jgi:hypothetical protein
MNQKCLSSEPFLRSGLNHWLSPVLCEGAARPTECTAYLILRQPATRAVLVIMPVLPVDLRPLGGCEEGSWVRQKTK